MSFPPLLIVFLVQLLSYSKLNDYIPLYNKKQNKQKQKQRLICLPTAVTRMELKELRWITVPLMAGAVKLLTGHAASVTEATNTAPYSRRETNPEAGSD